MSPCFAPVLFGPIPSALLSLLESGIATFRNPVLPDQFVRLRINAMLPCWFIAFPAVFAIAPLACSLVGVLDKVPAMQVQ